MSMLPTRDQTPQIVRSPVAFAQRPPGGPGGTQGGLTGRDVLGILRRRKWWIIISTAFLTTVAGVTTHLWATYAPEYEARAYIAVNPPRVSEIHVGERSFGPDVTRHMNRHAQMICRRVVFVQVAKRREVVMTAWYKRNKANVIEQLQEVMSAQVIRDSDLIVVRMTDTAVSHKERENMADVATNVAHAYVEWAFSQASAERRIRIQRLQDEQESLGRERDRIRADIAEVRHDATVPHLTERRSALDVRLGRLTAMQIELDLSLNQVREAKDAFKAAVDNGTYKTLPLVVQLAEQDPEVQMLRQRIVSYDTLMTLIEERFGERHKSRRDIDTRLGSLRKAYEEKRLEAIEDAAVAVVAQQNTQTQELRARRTETDRLYREASSSSQDLIATMTRLEQKRAVERTISGRMSRVEEALAELRLLSRGDKPVELAGAAEVPAKRAQPQWGLMMPAGVLLGLVVGLGLAFGLELLDTSIKRPSDVTRRVDLPLLGMVPHTDDLDEEIDEPCLAFSESPDSMLSEAFRQIRTCLLFSGPADQRRSLMITSPMPEDGRTGAALNLGAAIARGGRKVLVIDANFRQPRIGEFFPQGDGRGLSNALVGQADWPDLVHQVEPNLSVMLAGPLPPNPAELLGSEQAKRLVAEAVERYDQVIFDTAPCLVVTEPSVLSTIVDGVIIVIRAGSNTYGMIQRCRDMMARLGAHIVGVLLNGVKVTAGGYLRKNYDRFYEYGYGEALPGEEPEEEA